VSPIYPLSVHRRIERQWAERIKSLRRTGDQVVFAAKRTLQSATKQDGSLIPAAVGTVAERPQRDQFSWLIFQITAGHTTKRGVPFDFGDTTAQ
jgi:hypothetical protein